MTNFLDILWKITSSTDLYFITPQIKGRAVNKGSIDDLERDLIVWNVLMHVYFQIIARLLPPTFLILEK